MIIPIQGLMRMGSTSYDGERDDVGSRKQVAEYTSQE